MHRTLRQPGRADRLSCRLLDTLYSTHTSRDAIFISIYVSAPFISGLVAAPRGHMCAVNIRGIATIAHDTAVRVAVRADSHLPRRAVYLASGHQPCGSLLWSRLVIDPHLRDGPAQCDGPSCVCFPLWFPVISIHMSRCALLLSLTARAPFLPSSPSRLLMRRASGRGTLARLYVYVRHARPSGCCLAKEARRALPPRTTSAIEG